MLNSKLILFFIIMILGLTLRVYGINWDQNQHLHPDERFLTMVATAIKWPDSFAQYLDQQTSPLNPANVNFTFFVYGTLPLFIVKFVAGLFKMADYNGITIIGRYLSALFDTLTIVVVYKIANLLFNKQQTTYNEQPIKNILSTVYGLRFTVYFPLFSALFYALAVLPIQLSHFFAVDTFLVFFSAFSFYLALRFIDNQKNLYAVLSGIMLGFALASKISALFFLPFILLAFAASFFKHKKSVRNVLKIFISAFLFFLLTYVIFRLANPYAFGSNNLLDPEINPLFVNNLKQLKSWDHKETAFPPAVQWINTTPFIYPLQKILYYGLGLPIGIFTVLGIILSIFSLFQPCKARPCTAGMALVVFLTFSFFLYQSTQFVKAMRYFAFIYPYFAIFAALGTNLILHGKSSTKFIIAATVIIFISCLWPLSFLSIYSKPHSRLRASKWIYQNIPRNATLACEHWDDCLPLSISFPNDSRFFSSYTQYNSLQLTMYDPDSKEKWQKVQKTLEQTDYILLTSSRLYGSIMSVPEKYPETYQYYEDLFNGKLGFTKVAEFTSRPNLPIPFVKWCINMPFENYGVVAKQTQECSQSGISIVDDYTDESFTVYDHPKVVIFGKNSIDFKNPS